MTNVVFGKPSAVVFKDLPANDAFIQSDHPNEEAANNQCAPMAVANSLQFLKNTQSLALPHAHKMGLKGDDSLVGKLDETYQRPVTSRRVGGGVGDLLTGKLTYLANNNLAGRVSTRHWGSTGVNGSNNASVTSGGVTATSTGKGASVKLDEVLQALKEGDDCEIGVLWGAGGGHVMDIVGMGQTAGQPWIVHASDVDQSNDSAGAGAAGVQFAWLTGPDANGLYHLNGTNDRVVAVICEKYVPPPVTETVNETIDPAGHSCCVDAPPPLVSVSVFGPTMTVTGNAAWLPLSGTISANGAFSLSGTATVAGFSNVSTTFTGTSQRNMTTGTISVGTQGELPTGRPISWRVTINGPTLGVMPAVRVNGFRNSVSATAAELLRISLSMKAGAQAGQSGDWWLVAVAGGNIFYFDLGTLTWKSGLMPTFTGPLADIPFVPLPSYPSLPAGTYDFYFGFDAVPDGALTLQSLVYDTVRVNVQ